MHATLLIGKGSVLDNKISSLTKNQKTINFPLQKISDVRDLIQFTNITVDKPTTIILKNIHTSSIPAQNAFLKRLEEPQKNLSFILTANDDHNILSTIFSRCTSIYLAPSKTKTDLSKAKKFFKSSIGEKFTITQKLRSRDDVKKFTNELLEASHQLILKNPDKSHLAEHTLNCLNALKANGSPQLHLTNLVANLHRPT